MSDSDPPKIPGGCTGKGFQKGKSGNPGGPTKETAVMRAAAQMHWREALDTWLAIMRNGRTNPHARIAAADKIMDRAFGKAAQEIDLKQRPLSDMDNAELSEAVNILRAAIRGDAGGDGDGTGAAEGGEPSGAVSSVH